MKLRLKYQISNSTNFSQADLNKKVVSVLENESYQITENDSNIIIFDNFRDRFFVSRSEVASKISEGEFEIIPSNKATILRFTYFVRCDAGVIFLIATLLYSIFSDILGLIMTLLVVFITLFHIILQKSLSKQLIKEIINKDIAEMEP